MASVVCEIGLLTSAADNKDIAGIDHMKKLKYCASVETLTLSSPSSSPAVPLIYAFQVFIPGLQVGTLECAVCGIDLLTSDLARPWPSHPPLLLILTSSDWLCAECPMLCLASCARPAFWGMLAADALSPE
mmetsp:Transcript_64784/g.193052  ORF Transcript_64784/g.193052 Transcript_64784/m.193052 type:complete len:131 (-) Transcript_64784:20-412(-)|eukprot:CAMPEP_0175282046 /NCGR_PEP_ID=MMETSP0093-20121207/51428_1 /TAXON_ID=311494 /ORGANISM="Alexandrium monilatum, Strain CCMP3105" /LENGTH=130 /DNA_ID=CAMNT_0016577233 /DNA_START=126 /DNA_END=518 /DNA_ORIENTATION=+